MPEKAWTRRRRELDSRIEFPSDHIFLFFFECDVTLSLVEPTKSTWTAEMTNAKKLSLKRGDQVKFKTSKSKTFLLGTFIQQGPFAAVSKLCVYMQDALSDQLEIDQMDITKVYDEAVRVMELGGTDKETEAPNQQPMTSIQRVSEVIDRILSSNEQVGQGSPDLPEIEETVLNVPPMHDFNNMMMSGQQLQFVNVEDQV